MLQRYHMRRAYVLLSRDRWTMMTTVNGALA